jgi:hypothetical protein
VLTKPITREALQSFLRLLTSEHAAAGSGPMR